MAIINATGREGEILRIFIFIMIGCRICRKAYPALMLVLVEEDDCGTGTDVVFLDKLVPEGIFIDISRS